MYTVGQVVQIAVVDETYKKFLPAEFSATISAIDEFGSIEFIISDEDWAKVDAKFKALKVVKQYYEIKSQSAMPEVYRGRREFVKFEIMAEATDFDMGLGEIDQPEELKLEMSDGHPIYCADPSVSIPMGTKIEYKVKVANLVAGRVVDEFKWIVGVVVGIVPKKVYGPAKSGYGWDLSGYVVDFDHKAGVWHGSVEIGLAPTPDGWWRIKNS